MRKILVLALCALLLLTGVCVSTTTVSQVTTGNLSFNLKGTVSVATVAAPGDGGNGGGGPG